MIRKLLLATLAVTCSTAFAQLQTQGALKLDTGRVSGAVTGAANDISAYKGISYAAPPTGELRWRAPQPAKNWDGVRDATKFGSVCPQRPGQEPQSEDCLFMNVWTPAKAASQRLPVMVWVHGGGFTYGSGSARIYDGTRLAEHGVVVVTFNYRLNILSGFAHPLLSRESEHGSGNYGLLDQIAALKWVQRNIKAFGGDPSDVTLFGESAGGLSVSALVVSPQTKGLIQKAIVESGSGTRITPLASAEKTGQDYVKQLGVADDSNVLTALRAKSWQDLPNASNYRGAPVLDGWAFTDDPINVWAKGKQLNVPMIVGYNHDEATFFMARDGEVPKTADEFQASVRKRYGDAAGQLLALYPVKTEDDVYWSEISIRTEARMGLGARLQLRGMSTVPAKAFEYHFSHLPEVVRDPKRGVSHASELVYVFGTLPPTADQGSREMSEAIMNYWTQFAKTGDPNQAGLPQWPAFQKGNEAYLELHNPIHAAKDLNKDKLDVFEKIQRQP
ncbi:MAG: carboxylesterase family protein [Acidobacteriia bacterium]|nr:carboxylesterase family protein [Terriglobia bacterium]